MKKAISASLLIAGLVAAPMPTAVFAQESAGTYVDDAAITARVKGRFVEDPTVSAMRINVETKNGIVQISGFAESEAEKARAAALANSVPDVRQVQNNIVVRGTGDDATGESMRSGGRTESPATSSDSPRESSSEKGSSSGGSGSRY